MRLTRFKKPLHMTPTVRGRAVWGRGSPSLEERCAHFVPAPATQNRLDQGVHGLGQGALVSFTVLRAQSDTVPTPLVQPSSPGVPAPLGSPGPRRFDQGAVGELQDPDVRIRVLRCQGRPLLSRPVGHSARAERRKRPGAPSKRGKKHEKTTVH